MLNSPIQESRQQANKRPHKDDLASMIRQKQTCLVDEDSNITDFIINNEGYEYTALKESTRLRRTSIEGN